MRHRIAKKKLGRTAEGRRALFRGLMIAVIQHGKITTTEARAKAVQPYVESIIALGRDDTPHNRRMALSRLANKDAMLRLFQVSTRYADRAGGYTRLTRLGPRKGDAAEMVLLELV